MPDGVNDSPVPRWAADLNDEQRRAVEHGMGGGSGGEGPLVVLAGPGTGKTRVITHRVARLIEADGVRPESIVALTFTVKAAEEMRGRLASLVGPATAERVNAHTFHGFGRLLLRRFGDVLGLRRRWMLIDSAQRKRLLEEVIFEGRLFPQSAARGRTVEAPALERFICDCRNRAIFPEECLAYADRWTAACERNDAGLDADALAAERLRAAMFLDRARGYAAFERACRKRGWLTFDDLLTLPIRLLREHRDIAALCRDEYRHIVVDEFQDVNGAQIELLRLLAPPRAGGAGPDLCVVGDDDQAIYAFRGATERAFAHFERLWPGCATVELSLNYRSSEHVLRTANAIIGRAGRRFAPDKHVRAATQKQSVGAALPEGVVLDDDGACGAVIAAMIRADREENPTRPWRQYAVIARSNADVDRVGGQLELDGIPVRYLRALDAGSHEVVRDLKAWIELLVDPRARWAVQRVLARPPLGVPAVQVGEWVLAHRAEVAARQARSADGDGNGAHDEGEPFIAWLRRRILPAPDAPAGLHAFFQLHAELSALMVREPAHTVIRRIIEIVGLVDAGLGGAGAADAGVQEAADEESRERARRVAALVAFLRFSQSRIDRLDPPGGLAEFWSYYQDLDENDQRSLCADDEDRIEGDGAAFEDDDETDAVTVLTAHKAKGLEFDVVFIPRVRPGGFPFRKQKEDEDPLPRELRAKAIAAPEMDEDEHSAREDEERRLFYVACTRARRRLVLLAKRKRTRGAATDYFIELTQDETGLVNVRSGDEILATAAGAVPVPEVHDGDGPPPPAAAQDPRRLFGHRLRREARARIGSLTLRAQLGGLGAPEVYALAGEMGETAARLALAAHVERTGTVPAWALAPDSPVAEAAAAVAARLAGGAAPDSVQVLRPLRPPLKLSYSAVAAYERCPRCFYLAQTLGLEEDPGPMMLVGQAAHAALERFYRLVRDADAFGRPHPTAQELVRLGLEQLDEVWPRSRPLERAERDRLAAQLALFYERLHDPTANILEIEVWAGFQYERNGQTHDVHARIDRVDQLPDGSIRIIDYKTGQPSRRLLEPKPDDLQLGIYAMAARALLGGGDPSEPLRGRAEFWCLSTGERGSIDLADIDEQRVRERIDAAIDGMLAGRFPRADDCTGRACTIFGLDD